VDLRYAVDTSRETTSGPTPRALGVSLFATYYVPFFDLN
jgi:hypothetical protein